MVADELGQLNNILDIERAAFLSGDYSDLAKISEEKETILNQVFAKGPTVETLRRIKERLENNQNLNSAAIHGMKTAKARLADLENVRDHLTTYTPSGGVTIVPTKPSRVEKKS